MSVISQFFPSGDGSGGGGSSTKMDLEVLILSGGGGAAITCPGCLGASVNSGIGGGGAVFVGSVPVSPGCTVPIVVGAGGAGVSTPQPSGTNQNGARGGCSSITTPEGTICVAGGGAGIHAAQCAIGFCGPSNPFANHLFNGGTGGTGGWSCLCPGLNACCKGTGQRAASECIAEGGRPFYSPGQFESENAYCAQFPTTGCATHRFAVTNFKGPGQMNHKYGTFMGGASTGGAKFSHPSTPCFYNSNASGGAGGHAIRQRGTESACTIYTVAGKAYCSDITGTLEEYGRGMAQVPAPCYPTGIQNGDANSGRGGSVACGTAGCIQSGSGGSGVVIIRYPDQFPAAPASPGATDCSPATPGYYTYRFNSTGSITLP